jgi:hypothetical protein
MTPFEKCSRPREQKPFRQLASTKVSTLNRTKGAHLARYLRRHRPAVNRKEACRMHFNLVLNDRNSYYPRVKCVVVGGPR